MDKRDSSEWGEGYTWLKFSGPPQPVPLWVLVTTPSWRTSPAPAFCWVLVRLRFMRARSAQSGQSVPRLTLLLLPTLEYSSAFFFSFSLNYEY